MLTRPSKPYLLSAYKIWFSYRRISQSPAGLFIYLSEVRHALEEYGCFVAVYDDVCLELHNSIFHALEELFKLPVDIKVQNTSDKPYYGYIGQIPQIPLQESMGIDNATTLEGVQSFTDLMWPQGNHNFRETVLSYTKQVSELEQTVKRMVFESYGAEKHYEGHVGSIAYLLRFIKYRGPNINETNVGCKMHTDKTFITILHQNQVNGLEIQTKGGDWIGFEPSPSSFIVMAGDAFLAWSNGRIHSATHRVIMNGNEARNSLGLFSFHTGIVQIPEELIDDEHPQRFKPFDHFGLLRYFATNEAPQHESTAKFYCGV